MKIRGKRGQITIFIIIAIVIIGVLLVLFLPGIGILSRPSEPIAYIQDCAEKHVEQAIQDVSVHGGSIKPVHAIMYQGNDIEYLCYTNQYHETCVMQQPLLKQHIEREISDEVKGKIKSCFDEFQVEMRNRGYSVDAREPDIYVQLVPDNIKVVIDAGTILEKDQERIVYDEIELNYENSMYDLVMLATSILNWEARYGDTNIDRYMLLYPEIKVEKYKQGDGSKIFIITNINTKNKFIFATRSLSWPAGYGFDAIYVK